MASRNSQTKRPTRTTTKVPRAIAIKAPSDGSVLPFPPTPSASVAGATLQHSKHKRRAEKSRLRPDAPNVLIVLLDDVGFGLPDAFGGEVHTPTLALLRDAGIYRWRFLDDAVAELAAAAGAVAESIKSVSPTSLIGTAFGGGLTKAEVDILKKDAPPTERILGTINEGVATVKAKSPADAAAYSAMVLSVAQKTAEAAKEGGFLGIGGTQVSKEEQAALDAIRAALA